MPSRSPASLAAISSACGTSVPRTHQSDLAEQPVDTGRVGAGAGHPQHHALVTTLDQVERVLRAPGQLFEDGLYTVAGCAVSVQPTSQHPCVQPRTAVGLRHLHTSLSTWRIAFSTSKVVTDMP